MRIAWFGLGRFGLPMARRLLAGANTVFVATHGTHAGRAARMLVAEGARPLRPDTYVDVWATCLPTPADVHEVVDGLDAGRTPLVVDFSTGHPAAARELEAALGGRGVRFVDAPVSGSIDAAAAGALTVWVGAGRADAGSVLSGLLDQIAHNIFYLDEVGQGAGMKLVNQVVHIGIMAVLGEGLELARALGIDPQLAVDSMRTSSADSAMLRRFGDSIVREEFQPRFPVRLALKDVRYAAAAGPSTPRLCIVRTVERRLAALAAQGGDDLDFSLLASAAGLRAEAGADA